MAAPTAGVMLLPQLLFLPFRIWSFGAVGLSTDHSLQFADDTERSAGVQPSRGDKREISSSFQRARIKFSELSNNEG